MKQDIHQLLKEWDEYLPMRGNSYWKLEGITRPDDFFHHLPIILPHGSSLFFEGLEIGLSAKTLYEEHPAIYTRKVRCDGLTPKPDFFHVAFTEEFAASLCRLVKSQGMTAAFYHFKGYSETEVVFSFHDAFEGDLCIAPTVPKEAVQRLARALGCTAELTQSIDLRHQLAAIDRALNPPWWKKLLRISPKIAVADE